MTDMTGLFESANHGNSDSMYQIALAYETGLGVKQDYKQYLDWMLKAHTNTHPIATFNLSMIYYKGEIVEKDLHKAFDYALIAAEAGHIGAIRNIATSFSRGIGIEANHEKFKYWLEVGSSKKDPFSMYRLASVYITEEPLQQNNIDKAFELLKASANMNYADAMFGLYKFYKSIGPVIDKELSMKWLKRAANLDQPQSMYTLARIYEGGLGLKKNLKLRTKWLERAAKQNFAEAMLDLYFDCKKSTNEQTIKDGIQWLIKASSLGLAEAKFLLSIEYEFGIHIKKNKKLSNKLLIEASNEGLTFAMVSLAIKLKMGEIKEDIDHKKLLIKASNDGDILASIVLMFVDEISSTYLEEFFYDIEKLLEVIKEVKSSHIVTADEARFGVGHFTIFDSIESMLPLKGNSLPDKCSNFLRLYNIEYVNDPDEGKRLFNAMQDRKEYKKIHSELFKDLENNFLINYQELQLSIYSCSFTLAIDRLDLWRAYGKDGEGVCIVSPFESFKNDKAYKNSEHIVFNASVWNINQVADTETLIETTEITVDAECPTGFPQTLYKIKYKAEEIEECLQKLEPVLTKFNNYKEKFSSEEFEVLKKCLLAVLSDILFLYKSSEYENEKEARLIAAVDIRSPYIQIDERNPGKLYVKSNKFLFNHENSQIIIGPKVKNKKEIELNLKFRLGRHNFLDFTNVYESNVHYR